jgi:hypothetical protein
MIITYPIVDGIYTNETQWWIIYDSNTNNMITPPQQCIGKAFSPFTMVVSDTEEELLQYIKQNNLIFSE